MLDRGVSNILDMNKEVEVTLVTCKICKNFFSRSNITSAKSLLKSKFKGDEEEQFGKIILKKLSQFVEVKVPI